MNVPKLRFKEFTDEWIKIDLSTCFEYFSTNSLSREQLSDHGIIKNIHYGDIHKKYGNVVDVENDVATYIKDTEQINKYEFCCENDIIFADASEDYDGIGKAIELINVNEKLVSGLHTIHARDKKQFFSPLFKGYYFNTPIIHNQIRILANGFKVFGISKDNINNLKVTIPSKQEQEKIAKLLSLLDKKIELQTKKIEALKLFKKGLIVQTKSDTTQWGTIKIGNIFHSTRGVIISKSNISSKKENNFLYPVYSSQTSNNGILGYDTTYDFNGKYLTWTTDGANAGKVFYRKGKFRCTNVCGILFNDNDMYINKLMAELLNLETPKYVSYVGNPKLMNNIMKNITMKIPPLKKQIFISNFLEIIDNKIELEISILSNLKHLKKGLLQNMFV